MEPLATPGGICVSEDVARQITNKVEYPISKLKKRKLKNISMPMEIYCVQLPWLRTQQKAKKPLLNKSVITLAASILLAFLLSYLFIQKKPGNKTSQDLKFRLAVLPLVNISNDSKDDYFSDGMTEELISCLSKISELSVIARTSVMKYKTAQKDITEIGKELMVGTILEGSVRKFENKARITVQLIDVKSQDHIWSMDYDRELKDIFSIQSEIAENVANELEVRLVSFEKEQLDKKYTENMEAFKEYLWGKHFMSKKTSESILAAITHLESATEKDSDFALPYASLAYCYTLAGFAGYGGLPKDVARVKAKEAVQKALAIDTTLAEGHAALGYIKFRIDWDWQGAEQEFKRAIEIKPSYSQAHEWYGLLLAVKSRLTEAEIEMKKAINLDPLSPGPSTGLARIYHFRNETDKALEQAEKTLQLDPKYGDAYFTASMTYLKRSEYDKAEISIKKAIELWGRRPVMVGLLGAIYSRLGKTKEAMEILAELESVPVTEDKLYASALLKSNLGYSDEALKILEKLFQEKYGLMIYMKVEKNFLKEKDAPRFKKMLQDSGL
jgi:TolB-like protein/Tfp pilus assembly protein PilF